MKFETWHSGRTHGTTQAEAVGVHWCFDPVQRETVLRGLEGTVNGTTARLGGVTSSGLIRSEVRPVLAGVRHEAVPAYATHDAARHRTMVRASSGPITRAPMATTRSSLL